LEKFGELEDAIFVGIKGGDERLRPTLHILKRLLLLLLRNPIKGLNELSHSRSKLVIRDGAVTIRVKPGENLGKLFFSADGVAWVASAVGLSSASSRRV
jgi:hypothetical protein